MTSEKSSKVLINSKTWSRDSHKLYDYESSLVHKQQYIADKDCNILRIGNDVSFLESSQDMCFQQSESRIIAKIQQFPRGYQVQSAQDEELWLVVKTILTGYELETGDLVKLGRVKLRVKTIRPKGSLLSQREDLSIEQSGICRICLQDDFTAENPLISPCRCSGSMKTMHLSCLQTWINSKFVPHTSGRPTSFYWKNMDCEVCRHQYPLAVNWIGPNAHLSKIENSDDPYIVLETVDRDKNNSRSVYLLQFKAEEEFKLGRGHESDIKINDISVSRCHALIGYCNGKFWIKDNQSKFGTLVRIPQAFEIQESLTIQAGRTLLSLTIGSDSMVLEESDNTINH